MLSERTIGRLQDIVEDARRIEVFIDGMTLSDFMANERTIFAVERLLQRITEAAIQIDAADLDLIEPAFPIAQMRGLGNRLRHEYRDLDRAVIFDVARIEVPAIATAAELALSGMYDQ
jgi:uncharacterized protein with HEPN domain